MERNEYLCISEFHREQGNYFIPHTEQGMPQCDALYKTEIPQVCTHVNSKNLNGLG